MSCVKSNSECYILHAATEVHNWFGFKLSLFLFSSFQIITIIHVNMRQKKGKL